jgi:23S rRNA pseudouridine1911/1915/1917 synthase
MRFLEVLTLAHTELGDTLLKLYQKNKYAPESETGKEQITKMVRENRLYYQNKPVGFLPYKVFKKGKAQAYLELPGWDITEKDILFEDKWLIVVNKPSGLASQASLTFLQDHAYGAVLCHLRHRKIQTSPQLFLIHRLDMDTSGVLLMTKKASANKGMQNLFEQKKIQKIYWAISSGEGRELTNVKSYLGRKPDETHQFKFGSFKEGHPGAKFSETDFKLLKSKSSYKLYEVSPKTGRSHQIRVHMAEADLPILGDSFYSGEEASRLALHAKSLSFKHPMTDEDLVIEAPIDSQLQALLDKTGLSQ